MESHQIKYKNGATKAILCESNYRKDGYRVFVHADGSEEKVLESEAEITFVMADIKDPADARRNRTENRKI